MNEVLFNVIGAVYLLFSRHLTPFLAGFLSITIVGLEDCVVHWNPQLETIPIPTAVFDTMKFDRIPTQSHQKRLGTERTPYPSISENLDETYSMKRLLGQALQEPKEMILLPSSSSLSRIGWTDW